MSGILGGGVTCAGTTYGGNGWNVSQTRGLKVKDTARTPTSRTPLWLNHGIPLLMLAQDWNLLDSGVRVCQRKQTDHSFKTRHSVFSSDSLAVFSLPFHCCSVRWTDDRQRLGKLCRCPSPSTAQIRHSQSSFKYDGVRNQTIKTIFMYNIFKTTHGFVPIPHAWFNLLPFIKL